MKHTHIDSIYFTLLSWEDMDVLTRTLVDDIQKTDQHFDRIIAVANGGLTMARHFGDIINMRKISLLQTAFYADINKTAKEPRVLQPLAVDVAGEDLLVFEDIVDTGTTIEFIRPLLLDQYEAKSVTVASLVSKSWASTQPDYVAAQLDTWIIYPYETRESIQSLSKKWLSEGQNDAEISKRLTEIGFNTQDIRKFFSYNQA